jgi:ArsR family transcriptional regulator
MHIDDSHIFDIHADLCKAIANRTRLMMVALLAEREMSVGEMVDHLGISVTNASQHLRILRNNHIVQTRREGQTVYYSLTDPRLPEACSLIRAILIDGMQKRNEMIRKLGNSGHDRRSTKTRRQ